MLLGFGLGGAWKIWDLNNCVTPPLYVVLCVISLGIWTFYVVLCVTSLACVKPLYSISYSIDDATIRLTMSNSEYGFNDVIFIYFYSFSYKILFLY